MSVSRKVHHHSNRRNATSGSDYGDAKKKQKPQPQPQPEPEPAVPESLRRSVNRRLFEMQSELMHPSYCENATLERARDLLQPVHFDQILQERAEFNRVCAWPGCTRPIPFKLGSIKAQMDPVGARFCSVDCKEKALAFRSALTMDPIYVRQWDLPRQPLESSAGVLPSGLLVPRTASVSELQVVAEDVLEPLQPLPNEPRASDSLMFDAQTREIQERIFDFFNPGFSDDDDESDGGGRERREAEEAEEEAQMMSQFQELERDSMYLHSANKSGKKLAKKRVQFQLTEEADKKADGGADDPDADDDDDDEAAVEMPDSLFSKVLNLLFSWISPETRRFCTADRTDADLDGPLEAAQERVANCRLFEQDSEESLRLSRVDALHSMLTPYVKEFASELCIPLSDLQFETLLSTFKMWFPVAFEGAEIIRTAALVLFGVCCSRNKELWTAVHASDKIEILHAVVRSATNGRVSYEQFDNLVYLVQCGGLVL
eukprot:ANDGO_02144.mRNA.1 hypothetical protein